MNVLDAMPDLSERHEVRVRGKGHAIVFVANSDDGRLLIRQEPDRKPASEVCAITLADPEELRLFFAGLRRILASLGHDVGAGEAAAARRPGRLGAGERSAEDREAVVAQARKRNAQAFAPWTRDEEREIRRRHAAGESLEDIARAHNRSPRAIELRLQRLGELPRAG